MKKRGKRKNGRDFYNAKREERKAGRKKYSTKEKGEENFKEEEMDGGRKHRVRGKCVGCRNSVGEWMGG